MSAKILKDIYISYKETEHLLKEGARNTASKTIEDIILINKNIKKINILDDDICKNREINKLTDAGAEDGFSSNNILLKERITAFTHTYLRAREKNDLPGFFSCFSTGDPCLSGRMESLYKYAASLDGLNIDAMPDPEKSLFMPGSILAELMMENFDNEPSIKEFSEYLSNNISFVAVEFKNKENCDAASAFFEFLEAANIYKKENGKEVDWEELLENLIQSRYFDVVYQQSLRYVII